MSLEKIQSRHQGLWCRVMREFDERVLDLEEETNPSTRKVVSGRIIVELAESPVVNADQYTAAELDMLER